MEVMSIVTYLPSGKARSREVKKSLYKLTAMLVVRVRMPREPVEEMAFMYRSHGTNQDVYECPERGLALKLHPMGRGVTNTAHGPVDSIDREARLARYLMPWILRTYWTGPQVIDGQEYKVALQERANYTVDQAAAAMTSGALTLGALRELLGLIYALISIVLEAAAEGVEIHDAGLHNWASSGRFTSSTSARRTTCVCWTGSTARYSGPLMTSRAST